jgi:uncharacterized damage-inducible protein DinB
MITNTTEILVQACKNNVCLRFIFAAMKPLTTEYPAYYIPYVSLVENSSLEPTLEMQLRALDELFSQVTEEQANSSYAEGKWSMKEVLGHIIDTERIFAFRALCIARGESQALPGFDENEYVTNASFNHQSIDDLLLQLMYTRKSTLLLLRSLSEADLSKTGTANGKSVTANAIFWIIAGHLQHHLNVLNTRYLTNSGSIAQV